MLHDCLFAGFFYPPMKALATPFTGNRQNKFKRSWQTCSHIPDVLNRTSRPCPVSQPINGCCTQRENLPWPFPLPSTKPQVLVPSSPLFLGKPQVFQSFDCMFGCLFVCVCVCSLEAFKNVFIWCFLKEKCNKKKPQFLSENKYIFIHYFTSLSFDPLHKLHTKAESLFVYLFIHLLGFFALLWAKSGHQIYSIRKMKGVKKICTIRFSRHADW